MLKAADYITANRAGLGSSWETAQSFYTPCLQVAYNLGLEGVDISKCEIVTGFRFGGAPNAFISYNHAQKEAERGLSVYLKGMTVRGEFEDRGNRKEYTGLYIGKGSDGEAIILPVDVVENWDV